MVVHLKQGNKPNLSEVRLSVKQEVRVNRTVIANIKKTMLKTIIEEE